MSVPAVTAWTVLAPAASNGRGKCTAMAVTTVQDAAKANPSTIMRQSRGMWGLAVSPVVATRAVFVSPPSEAGLASTKFTVRGQPTMLANPASKAVSG
jgi:hypothetical protein